MHNLEESAHPTEGISLTEPLLRVTLKAPPKYPFHKNTKAVRKIVLLCQIEKKVDVFETDSLKRVAVLLKFDDKTRKTYAVKKDNNNDILFFNLLVGSNATAENAHFMQGRKQTLIPWTEITDTDDIYSNDAHCKAFYAHISAYAARKVTMTVATTDALAERAVQHGVQLCSFGCGKANDLIIAKKILTQNQIECSAFGIDSNPGVNAEAKIHEITLIKGDMRNLKPLLPAAANQKTVKVGMFIGSLVRQCLNGTEEGVKVMHQVKDFDVLFLTGFTDVLLNKNMAKAMGWQVRVSNINSLVDETAIHRLQSDETSKTIDIRVVYELQRMSDVERKNYLIKRGIKRTRANAFHCLDLSMSSNPLKDIKLFTKEELKAVKQIDLSWCSLNKQNIDELFKLITALGIPLLIVSGREDWLKIIKKPAKLTIAARTDYVKDEVPAVTPFEARTFGFYERLPNKEFL